MSRDFHYKALSRHYKEYNRIFLYTIILLVMEGKKIEDKTVDRLMDEFTTNLDVGDILAKCLSKELITGDDMSRIDATIKNGRTAEAVRDLMSRVKRSAPGYLTKFYEILLDSKSEFLAPYVAEGMTRARLTL